MIVSLEVIIGAIVVIIVLLNSNPYKITENTEHAKENNATDWQNAGRDELPSLIYKETRLVLVGRTGEGKSSTANSILGRDFFTAKTTSKSVTKQCDYAREKVQGKTLMIIDTPGIFDTEERNNDTLLEVTKSLILSSPGPHVFLFVISTQRFTEELKTTVKLLRRFFSEDIFRYTIIVFTRKDDLDDDGTSIDKYLENTPDYMQELLEACGRRYVAFNNRLRQSSKEIENRAQVRELLNMVDNLIEANKNRAGYYSSEVYKKIEEDIRKEEDRMKEEIEKERLRIIEPFLNNITKLEEKEAENQKIIDELTEENEKRKYQEEQENIRKKKEEEKKKLEEQNLKSEKEKQNTRDHIRRATKSCVECLAVKVGTVGAAAGAVAGAAFGGIGVATGAGVGFVVGSALSYVAGLFS